jgi:hypothetical protein
LAPLPLADVVPPSLPIAIAWGATMAEGGHDGRRDCGARHNLLDHGLCFLFSGMRGGASCAYRMPHLVLLIHS